MKPSGKFELDFDKKFSIVFVDGKKSEFVGRACDVINGAFIFYDSDLHRAKWVPMSRVAEISAEAV